MKNIYRVLAALILAAVVTTSVGAQEIKPVLDPESKVALQAMPIYEGVDNFRERVEKIRKEEKREPLGLVLCGGSARAFCHIGVLKALEENNIVPDFIIANSMGAIIGSLYAYGFSPEKIEEVVSKISLSQYFDVVLPVHGGMISVRKYEAFVDSLLGNESHDLKDSAIPVLLLSEDVISKRQIWHGEGDFASIMDAAFAMSFFMEPVEYTLQDGTKTKLVDSGTVDIAGLKIARSFSSNLIVSTAFYDVKVDLNNPIVILNRTFSIGKERIAIRDIMDFDPLLIRNEVEHFSFMDFQKAGEITQVGYDSAMKVMPYLVKAPHGDKIDLQRRSVTSKLADDMIERVADNEPMNSVRPYFGAKVWPFFGVTDLPDSYLFNMDGVGVSVFADLKDVILKGQVNFPFTFDQARGDVLFTYQPSSVFKADLFASYGVSFKDFNENNFFAFGALNFRPRIFPEWIKGIYASGEFTNDCNWKFTDYLMTAGMKFEFGNKLASYLYLKPFAYAGYVSDTAPSGFDFGGGVEFQSNLVMFKHFALGEYATARYGTETKLYSSDFYRANGLSLYGDMIATSATELCFYTPSTGFTFSEFLIFQQLKAGAFFDFAYCLDSYNSRGMCTGGFVRTDVSIIGLADFIIEAGGGFDITNTKPFAYFEMKNRM